MFFWIKVFVSAFVIAGVSEISKRSTWLGAIFVSLPLVSILTMVWVYWETSDLQKISDLNWGIFWAVLPSLVFFIALPLLLKSGLNFWLSLGMSCLLMAIVYAGYIRLLALAGIKI